MVTGGQRAVARGFASGNKRASRLSDKVSSALGLRLFVETGLIFLRRNENEIYQSNLMSVDGKRS